jgi:crossover junction endodeoxyribonuclease RuvC
VRVLGIDPGTATTGYGLVEGDSRGNPVLVEFGTIRTAPPTPMPERLREIHEGLAALIADLRPDAVAVEELFFSRNVTSAISVGQARGVILLAAAQAGLPVGEYQPSQVKLALTGYGAADKRQVQDMVRMLLRLEEPPRPDDAADGVAIALCHLQMARAPGADWNDHA